MSRGVGQTRVARVAACAVGLAFAARRERDVVDELLSLAECERDALITATRRVAGLENLDEGLRAQAITLLDASVAALDQGVALSATRARVANAPAHGTHGPTWRQGVRPTTPTGATGPRPPVGQEER